jgi:hypothetical protein
VAARPLETPRALPAALHPAASAITGRARPPLFTTGPATRHALAAAGALGATTGTVVHLPSAPGPSVSAVLAHELTHTRSPVRRPRFFLGGASSLLDDDERSALAAGRGALQSASGLVDRGRSAAEGLIGQGRSAADGLIGRGRSAVAEAGSTAAGIVDSLPVGGGLGAVGDVATRAARAAVMEAAASPMSAVSGLADQASGFADRAGGLASGAVDRASGMASDLASGVADTASGFVDQATDAVGGLAAQASSAAGAAKNALDPDKIVEIVEQRLLREIERRGGRWAGVF